MPPTSTFEEILEAVDHLPSDQQAELVDVLRRRLAEQGRQGIAADVRAARAEYQAGGAKPATAKDLLAEIDS